MSVTRALVIDDDEQDRAAVRMHLEDFGIEVLAPERRYSTPEELVAFAVSSEVDVTICDHRLQPRGLAPFYGAEAVAAMVNASLIAVLVTSYVDVDFDTSIRAYRRRIPAVLSRNELEEPEALESLISIVRAEIDGDIALERQLHPTIIHIGDVVGEGPNLLLDVFIPGWRPEQAVRMPAGLLAPRIADLGAELRGRFLIAEVNTAAANSEDVYFGSIDGPVEPADWPVAEIGSGTDFPLRSAGSE